MIDPHPEEISDPALTDSDVKFFFFFQVRSSEFIVVTCLISPSFRNFDTVPTFGAGQT
jgi:hypothetical protein